MATANEARLLRSKADSVARSLQARKEVAEVISDGGTSRRLKDLTKPNSVGDTMRKTGAALLLSPDPLTDIPGAVMLGASYVVKKKDPLSLGSVFKETSRLMSEMRSLLP